MPLEGIVGLFLPNMQDAISGGLQGMLGDPDGAGAADSPIADSIEDALANINVSGPIGESLGVNLTSHINSVVVDAARPVDEVATQLLMEAGRAILRRRR